MTLLEALRKIKSEREQAGAFPTYASIPNLSRYGFTRDEIRSEVKVLIAENKVKLRRGINEYFIEVI